MSLKSIIKYFAVWQLFILVVTAISGLVLTLRIDYLGGGLQAYLTNPFLYSRANFDGIHYLNIARNGYGYAEQAFFPLYPNLVRALGSTPLVGVLLSCTAFVFGLYFFAKLIGLDFSARLTRWTIVALLIFPTSFYFSFVYTEGLFFFLIISSFYAARTKHWWLAGILGILASYTRLTGIFLVPALGIEFFAQTKPKWFHLIPIILIPLGLVFYMTFLQHTVADPLAFVHVQKLFGQGRSDKLIMLYQVFWRYTKMIYTVNRGDPLYLTILLEAATGVLFFAISIYSFFRQRLSYAVFGFLSYLIPTLTGSFTSEPRYVLTCFASFIIFGQFLSKPSRFKLPVLVLVIILNTLYLALFVRGYWVS